MRGYQAVTISALLMLGATMSEAKEIKALAPLASAALCFHSKVNDKNERNGIRDAQVSRRFNRTLAQHQEVRRTFSTPTQSESVQVIKDNNDSLLSIARNPRKHPHVFVIGKTGSGKSTLVEGLLSMSPGKRFAIAPHFNPGQSDKEWRSCHGVFCAGRNYGSVDDEEISYEDITGNDAKNVTASQILSAIGREMDRRYKSNQDFSEHEQHDWIIDETPAIARSLKKYFGELIESPVYEARKVGLRIWILTQSDNVATLHLQGKGQIRENFDYIYLHKCAEKEVRRLKLSTNISTEDLVVCDSKPMMRPTIEELDTWIEEGLPESHFVQYSSPNETLTSIPAKNIYLSEEPDDERLKELISLGLNLGYGKTDIIKELFKVSNGKWRDRASADYDRLLHDVN